MNRLYFVRHGENRANLTKEFSCKNVDYSLTPKGRLQAEQTGEYFASIAKQARCVHEIYTSPLKRAVETAEIIAKRLGLPVTVIENFREVNVGYLESLPASAENWAEHNRIIADWLSGKPESTFPGGENYFTLWERMNTGLQKILKDKTLRNIMVVAHGGIFSFTLKDLCPGDGQSWKQVENHNCSISEILVEQQDGRLKGELVRWADITHLSGQAARLVSGSPEADTFKTKIG